MVGMWLVGVKKNSPPINLDRSKPLTLVVKSAIPSLNAVLAMNFWRRNKLKRLIQREISSCISRTVAGCSTTRTPSPNTTPTP